MRAKRTWQWLIKFGGWVTYHDSTGHSGKMPTSSDLAISMLTTTTTTITRLWGYNEAYRTLVHEC